MESNKKEGGIVQLVVVLGLITFICALLLGVINGVTADKIAQNAVETRDAAMAEIIPDAEFEDMNIALSADEVAAAGVTLPAGRTAAQIDGVYKATKDGEGPQRGQRQPQQAETHLQLYHVNTSVTSSRAAPATRRGAGL